jgi:hypothetical protein
MALQLNQMTQIPARMAGQKLHHPPPHLTHHCGISTHHCGTDTVLLVQPNPYFIVFATPPKFTAVASLCSKFSSPSSKLRSNVSNLLIISILKFKCFARGTAGGQRGSLVGISLLCSSLNFLLRLSTVWFRLGYCDKWTSATLSHAVDEIGRTSSAESRTLSTSSFE